MKTVETNVLSLYGNVVKEIANEVKFSPVSKDKKDYIQSCLATSSAIQRKNSRNFSARGYK